MATANTKSLTTDFNVSPYYDDFDETKNYHRLLFNPGYAVQARELTQIQSILQNQIDRFAEHIFKEGSVVSGMGLNLNSSVPYIRLRDFAADGTTTVNPSDFIGKTVIGSTDGTQAYVIDAIDGSEAEYPNTKTLYVSYTNVGTNDASKYVVNETLTSGSLSANTWSAGGSALSNTVIRVTYDNGIVFAKDNFIRVDRQSINASRYEKFPTIKIGYVINEDITTAITDNSLLDPAQGSPNENAPGADRLKLTATITTNTAITSAQEKDFIEMLRLQNGAPAFKAEKPQYSIINDYIARRTFDESGDYLVEGMSVRLREHLKTSTNQGVYTAANGGDANNLSIDVSPGKAYVKGYQVDNLLTKHVAITKGIDTLTSENLTIPINTGNYLEIKEVAGSFSAADSWSDIQFYDIEQYAISNTNITSPSLSSPRGSQIGSATLKGIQFESGNPGEEEAIYRAYLTNIRMSGSNSFSNVRSLTSVGSGAALRGTADAILNNANNAVLKEVGYNTSVFKLGPQNAKTLKNNGSNDVTYEHFKAIASVADAGGSYSISTGGDRFPFAGGSTLNDTQKEDYWYLVANTNTESSTNLTGTMSLTGATGVLTGLGTSFLTELAEGDLIKTTGAQFLVLNEITSADAANVHISTNGGTLSNESTVTAKRSFRKGYPIPLPTASGRTITINTTADVATIDINVTTADPLQIQGSTFFQRNDVGPKGKDILKDLSVELKSIGAGGAKDPFTSIGATATTDPLYIGFYDVLRVKQILKRDDTDFTTANYLTGSTDVTNEFKIFNGQRDNYYDHAYIQLKPSSSLSIDNINTRLLIIMDVFIHDENDGISYMTIDSYPINDTNPSATNAITTSDVPIFTSPTTGLEYRLRDSIDVRPRRGSGAAQTSVGGNVDLATQNPSVPNGFTTGAPGYIAYPKPNESFVFNSSEFYLPRRDRVYVTEKGLFQTIKGVPAVNPLLPPPPADGLTIGLIDVAAFPSTPFEEARANNSDDYLNVSRIKPVRQVRFTMKDIGTIKDRVDNLEYYTSLSMLESDTKNMTITDTNGLDRFKNGILVDPFTGHNVGNVKNPDYKISIDKEKNEIRPSFIIRDIPVEYNSTTSSGVEKNGSLVTLPIISHSVLVNQPLASNIRNATGLFYSWTGELELTPDGDIWTDTANSPDVQVDFDLNTDNWQFLANSWGTEWGSWETINRDVSTRTEQSRANIGGRAGILASNITTTTLGQQRTGIKNIVVPETQTQSTGTAIKNVNLIPFMRSRIVNFKAIGMKPGAKVYPFFDGEDVNDYCRSTSSSFGNPSSYGTQLTVDVNGEVYGQFRIPNNSTLRFRVGTKEFILTDNLLGRTSTGETTTFARDEYTASGLQQTVSETIISTRSPKIVPGNIGETRTVSTTDRSDSFAANPLPPVAPPVIATLAAAAVEEDFDNDNDDMDDPVAQSFTINTKGIGSFKAAQSTTGVFLSKIDLYFQQKDDTYGVSVQIREVDASSGYITSKILPFGQINVPASAVNISDDASAVTTVTFTTPIYVKANEQYAVVIKPIANNPNYSVWTARIGDEDLNTNEKISAQPASGIFFASSNDKTWNAIQEEDLKYTMYAANFGTNASGFVQLDTIQREYIKVENASGDFDRIGAQLKGETTLTLATNIGGANNNGDFLVGETSGANGTITIIDGASYRLKDVNGTFASGENGKLNNSVTSAKINAQETPVATIEYYDAATQDYDELRVSGTSGGTFITGMQVTNDENNAIADIIELFDIPVDTLHNAIGKFEPEGTYTRTTAALATSTTQLETTFGQLQDNGDTTFDSRKFILSKPTEDAIAAGARSGKLRVQLQNSANFLVSPVIDLDRATLAAVENIVNNDATGETNAAGGNALARYITKTVTLAENQDAEDLKIFLTAYKPDTSSIKVYYKILNANDPDDFENKNWFEMEQTTKATLYSDYENKDDVQEYEFRIPAANLTGTAQDVNTVVEYQYDSVTYSGYKYFAIKIALLSSTFSNVPRVSDLRTIALQA
jgi:hypothetical protein